MNVMVFNEFFYERTRFWSAQQIDTNHFRKQDGEGYKCIDSVANEYIIN